MTVLFEVTKSEDRQKGDSTALEFFFRLYVTMRCMQSEIFF